MWIQSVSSVSLFLSINAHKQGVVHLWSVVNWTNVILVSLLSVIYLQINLELIQGSVTTSKNFKFSQWLPMMMSKNQGNFALLSAKFCLS